MRANQENGVLGDERIGDAYDRNAAFWIESIRNQLDPYQTLLTDPALIGLLGEVSGLIILDAGCGEGYLTRELLARGAHHVTGVDTCAGFIDAANTHPEHDSERARFLHADVAALPLPAQSVDLVVVNRLPNAITDPGKRFEEFARVLAPDGKLIVLSMHPCFYTARGERGTDAGFDIESYFGVRTVEQPFSVAGRTSPAASVQSFYSLEASIGMLTAAGFVITALREPRPSPEQRAQNPWWDAHFTRPLFLLLECVLRA